MGNEDAYICVTEALKAAAWDKVNLEDCLVERGRGKRMKISRRWTGWWCRADSGARCGGEDSAATYALEHDKPYLGGLCLGMQMV